MSVAKRLLRALVAATFAILSCMPVAHADVFAEDDRVMLQFGPYVYHVHDNTGHNQWPRLLGAEYETGSHWLAGAAAFRNSYYQRAGWVYGGKRWFLGDDDDDGFYVKLAGGVVYGYKEPYDKKLPLNTKDGYGIAIVPAVGYQYGRANVQLVLLGGAAAIVTFGYDFWK